MVRPKPPMQYDKIYIDRPIRRKQTNLQTTMTRIHTDCDAWGAKTSVRQHIWLKLKPKHTHMYSYIKRHLTLGARHLKMPPVLSRPTRFKIELAQGYEGTLICI